MSWFSSHLLGTTAFITLRDGIGFGGANADDLCRDIDRADRVELAINSAGGCCRTANALFTALKGRCPRAVITGTAASSAALIMLAADTVQIAADGHVMLHPPRATIFATAPELRESAAYLDSIADNWIARVTERTRRPIAEVVQWFAGPDRWFSAADAKAVHLVDEVFAPAEEPVANEIEREEQRPLHPKADTDFFFSFLRAYGLVSAADPDKFLRELMAWGKTNVKQL